MLEIKFEDFVLRVPEDTPQKDIIRVSKSILGDNEYAGCVLPYGWELKAVDKE